MAIKSDGETLEDSDEWALSKDSDGLDSDDEKITLQVSNPMSTVVKWQNITLLVSKFKVIQICV